jgi:hypothetical protein
LWNEEYYQAACSGERHRLSARHQVVYALNLRANKILETRVERVHRHRGLGVADLTPESVKQFCHRWFPNEYENVSASLEKNPETVYMDFEYILSATERLHYDEWLDLAKRGNFTSTVHKGFVTGLLILHATRSYEFMSFGVQAFKAHGIDKWEFFWILKQRFWGATRVAIELAESAVTITVWMILAILLPHQLQRKIAMMLQVLANGTEIRLFALSPDLHRPRRAGHGFLESPIVPVRRQWPFHAGRGRCFQV